MNAQIQENIAAVEERIARAARESGRTRADITMVAVSKTKPLELIEQAWQAGIRIFGENRVQELVRKQAEAEFSPEWQFIGHLQTNKVRQVAGKVALIHSLDSYKLAQEVSGFAVKHSIVCPMLVQVNTSGEESKFGITSAEVDDLLGQVLELPGIRIEGLMTIGPLTDNEKDIARSFTELRTLFERLKQIQHERLQMRYLSMGMSGDFELAIQEGSNLVRLGTILFGSRN
jgi:pyridoxal phosphate enzyme (YggS family)